MSLAQAINYDHHHSWLPNIADLHSSGALPITCPAKSSILPEPTAPSASGTVHPKRQPTFTLGVAYPASEQGRSLETRKPLQSSAAKKPAKKPAKKHAKFALGGSPEDKGSVKPLLSARVSGLVKQYKQTSFGNHATLNHPNEPSNANKSGSDDDIDESAISDEGDSSGWDDVREDSSKSDVDGKDFQRYFQRGDSKVSLTPCRSLITLMIAQSNGRARNVGGYTSQLTSATPPTAADHRQRPSVISLPNNSDDAPLVMRGTHQPTREIPRSGAQPITGTTHTHGQAALSPRTTRRNMLSAELTQSLHRHLLWERSRKSITANAVLKRRHTSRDVADLKQYPEKAFIKQGEDINSNSWSQYFAEGGFDGYHSKGW